MQKYSRHNEKEGPTMKELMSLLQNQLNNIVLQTDGKDFLSQINTLDQTLELLDEEPDPALYAMVGGYVKEFVTSFLILYFGTHDLEKALAVHSQVKALTKYIVLLDKHYDEKSYDYKVRADSIFKKIMSEADGYVKSAIKHNMALLWATATYEIKLRGRMLHDEIFDKKEIRYHLLQKSSDTILYSVIFDKYVEKFNSNVMNLLHYNQAVMDIQDDLNDIQEDILHRDLNVFIMACRGEFPVSDIFNKRVSSSQVIRKSSDTIKSIINDLEECITGTEVPQEFSFMKVLGRHYVMTLRDTLKDI